MHIYVFLVAFVHVPLSLFVTGAPLTVTPLSSIVTTNSQDQQPFDHPFVLISSPLNESSRPSQRPASTGNLSSLSNTTLISPQGMVPYPVKGTPTTLTFHNFGARIPSDYMLKCLSLSLTIVLEVTLSGKGNNLIKNGYFTHKHVMPNGHKVTIIVADFRELGKPITYNILRDILSGVGDFVTDRTRKVTTLSYEIDVERMGYVGTGHVDYDFAESTG